MPETVAVIPQHVVQGALGPLLVGTWLNTALFSFEVTQVYRYFNVNSLGQYRSAKRASTGATRLRLDPVWIRLFVLWMFALDIASSGVACALVYTVRLNYSRRARINAAEAAQYTVTGWGNITILLNNNWYVFSHNFVCN